MDEEEVDGMLAELTETYMARIDEVATSAAGKAVALAEKRLEEKLLAKIPKVRNLLFLATLLLRYMY